MRNVRWYDQRRAPGHDIRRTGRPRHSVVPHDHSQASDRACLLLSDQVALRRLQDRASTTAQAVLQDQLTPSGSWTPSAQHPIGSWAPTMQQMQRRYAGTPATCSTCDTPQSAASAEPESLAVSFARQRAVTQRADRPAGRVRDHVPMVVDSIVGGESSHPNSWLAINSKKWGCNSCKSLFTVY